MRNTLLSLLSLFLLGAFCWFGLPWWLIVPFAMVIGWLFPQSPGRTFLSGFVAGFALWCSFAWYADHANEGLLSHKIGQLFQGSSSAALLIVTGVFGGLLAGLGMLTGRFGRDLVAKTPKGQSV